MAGRTTVAFVAMLSLAIAACQKSGETKRSTSHGVDERVDSKVDSTPATASESPDKPSGPPVLVESPERGALISSPVRVTGRARGSWYFEADFPVRLLDAHDKMIGTGVARAQGEWMTSDYVPFEVSIVFHPPLSDSTGTLVFEKSNPSGLAKNAADVRVPVRFH